MNTAADSLTPEKIRETALMLLSTRVEGVRQTQLFKDTELELSFDYEVPEHSIKNALWDLPEKYPSLVTKKKISARSVILYPTKQLVAEQQEKRSRLRSDNIKRTAIKIEPNLKNLRLTMLVHKVLEIAAYIEMSEIDELTQEILAEYSSELGIQELEAVFGIKSLVKQFNNYRNALAHGNNLRS